MNTSETIDIFSDALLDDERIVTSGEREFLADLLRRSKTNPHPSSHVVTETIAQIAGEIVVQRASNLMADHILRKLTDTSAGPRISSLPPRPPTPQPPSPGPTPGGITARSINLTSLPPRPPTPQPPSPGPTPGGVVRAMGPKGILNLDFEERSESLPRCVVLEEFLAPAELNELLSYTLMHEAQFKVSEVISPGVQPRGAVDFEYRRSHVLMDLGLHYDRFIDRLQNTLPRFLSKLGMQPFPVSRVEAQITASKDGDFFRWHNDNGQDEVSARRITFVYFFHREPKAFEGGELCIQSRVIDDGF